MIARAKNKSPFNSLLKPLQKFPNLLRKGIFVLSRSKVKILA